MGADSQPATAEEDVEHARQLDPAAPDADESVAPGESTEALGLTSFIAFYEDAFPAMVRLAYLLVGSQWLAEDLVHDSFARVYTRWSRVRQPMPYLRRSVVNACRSAQRRAARERRLTPIDVPTHDSLDADEMSDALGNLPYRQRAALVLRYYESRSYAEIGESLGCRETTARSLVHRGTEQLRRVIEL
jgi:RNA polymerase sigma factor (sigma-70 family)